MMHRLILFLAMLLVASCGAGPKSFYVLTADGPAPTGGGQGLGIGPVTLAEYIDRANLVLASSPNQLAVAEDHRWAGDLSAAVARVTATNLGRRLHTGNVRTYPWNNDGEIRYQITLDIRQLHAGTDGFAVIEAGWRVYSLPERKLKTSRSFVDREPLESDGYPALVAAQSRLLSRLAKDIAAGLQ
jgi:uncharacterized lipoprotein YmbA